MRGPADAVQGAVHALEQGAAAIWMRRALVAAVIASLALLYLLHEFRGLATSEAMDQAQIGRELLLGHGWETKFARPLAAGELRERGNPMTQVWVDTYNAPLPPLVNALALFPVRSALSMSPQDIIYTGDRMIALVAVALFLASVAVLFLIARRLFDQRLAAVSCGLVLIGDTFWRYALSGLPQMLMLLLFCLALYALLRAVEAQRIEQSSQVWLCLTGAAFGLLALTHALTIWIFLAAVISGVVYFRPRTWTALLLVAPFLVLYAPWLIRNYLVCGNPFGVALYSILDQIGWSEAGHMRHLALDFTAVNPGAFRIKVAGNFTGQMGQLFRYFGWNPVALFFFASLLHPFRRHNVAAMRWLLLGLWIGAVAGMAIYGLKEEQGLAANQLHLLFVPIMTCFGLAFLLVQWSRLEIRSRIARTGFFFLLLVFCGWPMVFNLALGPNQPFVRWPPYAPPYLAVLHDWIRPDEIVASDMPWAIAWYADRRAVWLPETVRVFTELSDFEKLGGPIRAIYLTPVSGSQNSLREIEKGEYKDWGSVILRRVDLEKFPLKWATLLGPEDECVLFTDQDRSRQR